jgi:hypothetical protein
VTKGDKLSVGPNETHQAPYLLKQSASALTGHSNLAGTADTLACLAVQMGTVSCLCAGDQGRLHSHTQSVEVLPAAAKALAWVPAWGCAGGLWRTRGSWLRAACLLCAAPPRLLRSWATSWLTLAALGWWCRCARPRVFDCGLPRTASVVSAHATLHSVLAAVLPGTRLPFLPLLLHC